MTLPAGTPGRKVDVRDATAQYFVLFFPEALVSKLSSETHAQAASLAPQPPGLKEFPQVDGRGRQEDTDDEPEVSAVMSPHGIVCAGGSERPPSDTCTLSQAHCDW